MTSEEAAEKGGEPRRCAREACVWAAAGLALPEEEALLDWRGAAVCETCHLVLQSGEASGVPRPSLFTPAR